MQVRKCKYTLYSMKDGSQSMYDLKWCYADPWNYPKIMCLVVLSALKMHVRAIPVLTMYVITFSVLTQCKYVQYP